ncbi:hypothetical protein [Paenibacillus sp. TC-CSREp1]|uniref:hypothetical protein n=1 Tax=Paenibacillus sp. TC-CSREp1 TaxID=3410089 RepID=UPI003D075528
MLKKLGICLLAVLLTLTSVSWPQMNTVSAAADYQDIWIPNGGGKIMNRKDMSSWNNNIKNSDANSFGLFAAGAPGTSVKKSNVTVLNAGYVKMSLPGQLVAKISVASNPTLRRLAEGGQARMLFKIGSMETLFGFEGQVSVSINGSTKFIVNTKSSVNSSWIAFGPNDTIEIELGGGTIESASDIELYFADITPPTYNGNTFTHNGAVRFNADPAVQKNELFLKQGSYMNLALNFSEPVFPSLAEDASEQVDGKFSFMRTELFSNPGGDGFEPSTYYLTSADSGYSNFALGGLNLNSHARSTFNFRYQAAMNDSTGNIPIDPKRLSAPSEADRPTFLERMNAAGFIDGAGNPVAAFNGIGTVPFADNAQPGGTFRTIIDARVPQYSASRNGVQPEVLTGLVLNKGDVVDFTVYLNEQVISAFNPTEDTRLKFANGLTAAYVSGQNTNTWTFRMTVPDGKSIETSLLETAALEHASNPGDGKALTDYAGNVLVEPVKNIAWADLSVDNTAPEVNFVYENQHGEVIPEGQYVGDGSFTIQAFDPDLNGQASKGLFRPGSGSGLVYYVLNQSQADPFAGKDDHFAAVKRYSLTQKQPADELYPSGYEGITLSAGQNGTKVELPNDGTPLNGNWYLHTWTADMTWDSARQRMQYDKGSTERAAYLAQHPDATPAELEEYYRQNILPNLSDYGNVAQWPLSDFMQDDSNWSYHVGLLKIDNDDPNVEIGNVVDNNSDNVKITVRATDPTSSIKNDKIQYQFVAEGKETSASGWQDATLNAAGEAEISTLKDPAITKGGRYELHVKAQDVAGHSAAAEPKAVDVLVISTKFKAYPGTYAINDGPDFTVAGVPIDTIEYQYTQSSERPAGNSKWTAFEDAPKETKLGDVAAEKYSFPADKTLNGTWYAHVRIKQQDTGRYYYYYQEYKFDHLPPNVKFGSQGYLYPMPEQSVQIDVSDTLVDFAGVAAKNIRYQWIKVVEGQEEQEPDPEGKGWSTSPADRLITLQVDNKKDNGNYRLYVHASDSLGNSKMFHTTGVFSVFYLSSEPPVGSARLIRTEGPGDDGYTAIMELTVDVPAQEGYFYSVSTNGGDNWSTWLPYTNYVGVPVDTDDTGQLKSKVRVKFKGFYDNISEIVTPEIQIQDAPAYALASLEQITPIRGGEKVQDGGQNEGQEIVFDLVDGKTVKPTDSNPEMPETLEANKRFKIYRNGSYSFTVKDGDNTATVFIVVSNFDDTPPVVNVKYSTIAATNGTVKVSLKSSEPIRITNLPTSYKNFKENGEFTFEYEDAVGFTGSVTATVSNIDTTPPEADITLHYNHPDLKALIRYGAGTAVVDSSGDGYNANGEFTHFAVPTRDNVVASNLIVAQVLPKAGEVPDYQVVSNSAGTNQSSIVMTSGSKARFSLADAAGNSAKIESEAISTLVGSIPAVDEVTMVRVDNDGQVIDGSKLVQIGDQTYSKGKVRVGLLMPASAIEGNVIYAGATPVSGFSAEYATNGEHSILLSDLLGNKRQVNFTIEGLDNTAPTIRLNKTSTTLLQNKPNFDLAADLGGYVVSDNLSSAENIQVTAAEYVLEGGQYVDKPLNLTVTGKHTLRYTAKDQLGNVSYALQTVFVRSSDGMFVTANGLPLSDTESETAIVNTGVITFNVNNFRTVGSTGGTKLENELGTYDVYYFPGLVREGQLKYIATKVTYKELVSKDFKVTLPKAGWYTIVVQNSERERVYSTLLVNRAN